MAELLITLPNGRTMLHTLAAHGQVAGRDLGCDIHLDDPSTSRRHARLLPTSQGYLIEDLGSKNGTMVNGELCASQKLQDGDEILLGSVRLVFSESASHTRGVLIDEDLAQTRAPRHASRDPELTLPQRRLQIIYDLGERLTTLQNRDGLLESALSIGFEMLDFERGAVGVRKPGTRRLEWPVVRDLRGAEGELKISRTILHRALEHGERAVFTEGDADDPAVSIVQQGIRSAICVPLMHGDEVLGVIYGDRISSAGVYAVEDMDFLAGIAHQVSIGLINSYLLEEQKRMLRLQQDLDIARSIQRGLFPKQLPCGDQLTVEALNDPGNRVSGDYYDVIKTGDGRVWLLVADVTGEGVAAALLMANLQAAVWVTIEDCDDPGALLARWNRQVFGNTDVSKFVTCVVALIDPATREIRFASAGHLPPLLVRGHGQPPVELAGEPAYPLGVVEDERFQTISVDAGREPFVFFCYTDGVTEAMNLDGDQFEKQRLYDLLAGVSDLNARDLVKQVRAVVADFAGAAPQSDDITMLAARVG